MERTDFTDSDRKNNERMTEKIIQNGYAIHKLDESGNNHCVDGPAVIWPGGTNEWWLNGKRHRVDGPAYEAEEYKAWYLNGLLHREDGPAIEEYHQKTWWLNGRCLGETRPENWEELILLAQVERVMND